MPQNVGGRRGVAVQHVAEVALHVIADHQVGGGSGGRCGGGRRQDVRADGAPDQLVELERRRRAHDGLDGGGGARPRGLLVQQGRGGRSGGGARAADASRARVLAPSGRNGT